MTELKLLPTKLKAPKPPKRPETYVLENLVLKKRADGSIGIWHNGRWIIVPDEEVDKLVSWLC